VQPDTLAAELERRSPAGARIEPIGEANGDLDTFVFALRLVALILIAMAAINLLTSMLTSTRESARRVGIAQTVGFTPRQLIIQGAISGAVVGFAAVLLGVPFGLWLFGVLSDLVGRAIGIGPGWMPGPGMTELGVLAVVALVLSAGLGALAVAQLARRPAAQLVRWE
jgi:ABC-type antimicrobial peptide transport system permease subunit